MLRKIAVVLKEGIKLRERERKERSPIVTIYMSGCLGHVFSHVP
jgi:hypothetical protein